MMWSGRMSRSVGAVVLGTLASAEACGRNLPGFAGITAVLRIDAWDSRVRSPACCIARRDPVRRASYRHAAACSTGKRSRAHVACSKQACPRPNPELWFPGNPATAKPTLAIFHPTSQPCAVHASILLIRPHGTSTDSAQTICQLCDPSRTRTRWTKLGGLPVPHRQVSPPLRQIIIFRAH